MTQSQKETLTLGPFPNGTVSQAALPVSQAHPFPQGYRDGYFPLVVSKRKEHLSVANKHLKESEERGGRSMVGAGVDSLGAKPTQLEELLRAGT